MEALQGPQREERFFKQLFLSTPPTSIQTALATIPDTTCFTRSITDLVVLPVFFLLGAGSYGCTCGRERMSHTVRPSRQKMRLVVNLIGGVGLAHINTP